MTAFFAVFLNFHPNRFCFIWEPHELVCKSARAIQHSFVVSIFLIFSKFSKFGIWFPDFSYSSPTKCVLGPRTFFDVLACPKIH